jgi:carbon monoxide dehydrogenase subunit G
VRTTVRRRIAAPPEGVWTAVADIGMAESMLPGCERLWFDVDREHVETGDRGRATLSVAVGPVEPSFETRVAVLRRERPTMAVAATGTAAGSRFDTTAALHVESNDGADRAAIVTWRATATVTGRLGRFGSALEPVVDAVATRFFDRLEAALADGEWAASRR